MKITYIITLLFCLTLSTQLWAKKDTYTSATITGAAWNSAAVFSTAVPQAPMTGTTVVYITKNLSGYVKLWLNTNNIPAGLPAFTAKVPVNIEYFLENEVLLKTENGKMLEVNYDPLAGASYKNLDVLELKNCRSIKVTIIAGSIQLTSPAATVTLAQVQGFISINAFIEHERFYNYCNVFGPGTGSTQVSGGMTVTAFQNTNELLVAWWAIPNVEGYELEYTFVEDYADAGYLSTAQINFSFRHNSTRILLDKSPYRLPLVQEHGYYFFRVRGYGKAGPGYEQIFYGPYAASVGGSSPNQLFTAAAYPVTHQYHVDSYTHTADKINWQSVTSFAEEGKSKTVVTYMDGTLRSRQTVTATSTERNAIVAETVYDRQGRPAVNILPAPVSNPAIRYYNNLNQNMAGQPYSYTDFDIKGPDTCAAFKINPLRQQNNQGAANYYSQYNPSKKSFHAFIPEANGYPFTRVNYMPDATDRVVRQGGVGEIFQPGNTGVNGTLPYQNHDTKYYYGKPEQYKLDRLFGTNVGYAEYYQKNLVVDANGQASVTYVDLDGKTVATALAGQPPANVDALNSFIMDTIKVNLLKRGDVAEAATHSLTASQSFLVSADSTPYRFQYTLPEKTFNALGCAGSNYCLDCIYDLEITLIKDECSKIEYHLKKTIGRLEDLNFLCGDAHADTAFGFTAILYRGSYTITRKLSVNKAAAEQYANRILNDTLNTCLKSYEDFYEEAWNNRDTLRCKEACAACGAESQTGETAAEIAAAARACDSLWCNPQLTTMCDLARMSMINDLRPGGQYALWKDNFTNPSPISIFSTTNVSGKFISTSNNIPVTLPGEPQRPLGYYMGSGPLLEQLVNNWPDDLSEQLLPLHPEYCYLQFCGLDSVQQSNTFDSKLMNANTYADAQAVFGATTVNAVNISSFYSQDPLYRYFQLLPDVALKNGMGARFTNYTGYGNSIVQLALFMANCPSGNNIAACPAQWGDPVNADEEWEKFKLIYFSLKQEYMQKAREHYVLNTAGCCPNYYIGCDINTNCPPFIWSFFSFPGNPCFANKNYAYINATRRFTTINDIKFDGMPRPDESLYDMKPEKLAKQMTDSIQNGLCPSCPEMDALKMMIWHLQHKSWLGKDTTVMADAIIGLKDTLRQRFMGNAANGPVQLGRSGNQLFIRSSRCTISIADSGLINWERDEILPTCLEIINYKEARLHVLVNDSLKTVLPLSSTCELFYCQGKPPAGPVANYTCRCDSVYDNTKAYRLGDVVKYKDICFVVKKVNRPDGTLTPGYYPGLAEYWERLCTQTVDTCAHPFIIDFDSPASFLTDLKPGLAPLGGSEYVIQKGFPFFPVNQTYASNVFFAKTLTERQVLIQRDAAIKPNMKYRFSFDWDMFFSTGLLGIYEWVLLLDDHAVYSSRTFPNLGWKHFSTPLYSGNNSKINVKIYLERRDSKSIFVMDNFKLECLGNANIPIAPNNGPANAAAPDTSRYIPVNACGCNGICNVDTPMPPMELIACDSLQQEIAIQAATDAWSQYRDSVFNSLLNGYYAHCMKAADSFTMDYADPEYHYTLYYYDQSGNLVRTVPPAGVRPLSDAQTAQVEALRDAGNGTGLLPPHTMASSYKHNSLNAVVWQQTPDAGVSSFYYDRLGRIAVSRNAKQIPRNASYTFYDALGRTVETGAIRILPPAFSLLLNTINANGNWMGFINALPRQEITRTYYDKAASGAIDAAFGVKGQQYLRSRIGTVATYADTTKLAALDYEQATHYSYDIAGNVNNLLQDFGSNAPFGKYRIRFQSKHIAYSYDLVSGKVNSVQYQPGHPDQFLYRYQYNADNKLTHVFTSREGIIWENDARYQYYRHGPLARTELGTDKVQGLDYAYTLQGWIKGVNGYADTFLTDMGQDGNPNPPNWYDVESSPMPDRNTGAWSQAAPGTPVTPEPPAAAVQEVMVPTGSTQGFPAGLLPPVNPPKTTADVYSYWLSYYQTDYQAIGRGNAVVAGVTAPLTTGGYHTAPAELFNGNIRSMFTRLQPFGGMGMQYRYDQLNRIKKQEAWSFTGASATPAAANAYTMALDYDANGNIQKLLRNGTPQQIPGVGGGPAMDSLNYKYFSGNNRLRYVTDNVANGNYTTDIDNQPANNYQYDLIGNLTRDVSEGISAITWNLQNKISRIQKTNGMVISYEYDALGNRILKQVTQNGRTQRDYYVRDAQGNTLALYTQNADTLRWAEQHLYGSSRLGVYRPEMEQLPLNGGNGEFLLAVYQAYRQQPLQTHSTRRNCTEYELTNHLGNVLATITDAKTAPATGAGGTATVLTATDYYAFGMGMPGRSVSANYRYGFNGKEGDKEMGTQDYGMRIYNPALCKFLSLDPYAAKFVFYSPYHFAGNSPIMCLDLDGAEDISFMYKQNKEGKGYTLIGKTDYRQTKETCGSLGHGIQVIIINNNGDVRKEFMATNKYSKENLSLANRIGKALEGPGGSADRLLSKAMGSFDNYGEGEGAVKAGKFGIKGKIGVNKYSAGFDLNAFGSSENTAGLALELNFETTLKTGANGPSFLEYTPTASLEGYASASNGAINSAVQEGGVITADENVMTIQAGISPGGANAYVTEEINLTTGKKKETGTISVGKTSNSIGFKNKASITFSTGEKKVSN